MSACVIRSDAANLPLADESVDLVVTSPPYFALRDYKDAGEGYDGQIGSEPTPQEFLEALWACTSETQRVLKKTGSIFVNLGDKYSGSGGHNNAAIATPGNKHAKPGQDFAERRTAPISYNKSSSFGEVALRDQCLMGLPWRYAIGCTDGRAGAQLVLRAEIVWSKPNGLPESVRNRVARAHEQWFHLTKLETGYYTAVDEIREPYQTADRPGERSSYAAGSASGSINANGDHVKKSDAGMPLNPLGKLPGSVWTIPTESLDIPQAVQDAYNLPSHFAAFPSEWPRRLILGFSPNGICLECGEGRRPYAPKIASEEPHYERARDDATHARHMQEGTSIRASIQGYVCSCTPFRDHEGAGGSSGRTYAQGVAEGGYASNDFGGRLADRPRTKGWREYLLDEWQSPPPTRPAVVLDPFGGTGTTAMVARALGRYGVSVDMSADYCRLAQWRIFKSGHWKKTRSKELAKTVKELF